MKFLTKINKGAFLSIIVLIVLVIYLIIVSINQTGDQPALKEACQNYIDLAQQYSLLPADYVDGTTLMTSSQQEQYMTDIKNALTPLFDSKNTAALNTTCNSFKKNLEPLFAGQVVVSSNQITITQYEDFTYSNDLVSVTFSYNKDSNVKTNVPQGGNSANFGVQRNNTGVITFKKVDNSFKIVSVNVFNNYVLNQRKG